MVIRRIHNGIAGRIARDERGGIAVMFALAVPVMLMLVGGAVDYGMILRHQQALQNAADAASMAAAKELTLIDYTRIDANGTATNMVSAMMASNTSSLLNAGTVSVSASVTTDPIRVTVNATQSVQSLFGPFGLNVGQVAVTAVAQVNGRPNVCVLGLNTSQMGTLYLEKAARMTGQNCAVYSNSTHSNGIVAKNTASLTASMICTAGGKAGGPGNYFPDPLTDCPKFDDPLASRQPPSYSGCDFTKMTTIKDQTTTLSPGVYCGGLTISGTSKVTFQSGIYVIKDGPFTVTDTASVSGEYVGFFFTGSGAFFKLDTKTTITLSAPKDGAMAGLLFFENRGQAAGTHEILSDNARQLLGTIYLPISELRIDANNPIADQSAYTAIVANTLTLYSGPNLILNTSYDKTPVPVPEGIKGVGQPVSLVH